MKRILSTLIITFFLSQQGQAQQLYYYDSNDLLTASNTPNADNAKAFFNILTKYSAAKHTSYKELHKEFKDNEFFGKKVAAMFKFTSTIVAKRELGSKFKDYQEGKRLFEKNPKIIEELEKSIKELNDELEDKESSGDISELVSNFARQDFEGCLNVCSIVTSNPKLKKELDNKLEKDIKFNTRKMEQVLFYKKNVDRIKAGDVSAEQVSTDLALSSGLNWQTAVVTGLAEFLADRFKAEVNVYFMQQFQEVIKDVPELKYLFPRTTNLLASVDSWNYGNILSLMRNHFVEDLRNMHRNFSAMMEVVPYSKKMCGNANLQYLYTALNFMIGIEDGDHPVDLLAGMTTQSWFDNIDSDELKNGIRLVVDLSGALREKEGADKDWISLSKIKSMDDDQKKFYYGLIYHKIQQLIIEGKTIAKHIDGLSLAGKVNALKALSEEISNTVDRIIKRYEEVSKEENEENFNKYYRYVLVSFEGLKEILEFQLGGVRLNVFEEDEAEILRAITTYVPEIFKGTNEGSFSVIVSNVVLLLTKTLPEAEFTAKGTLLKYGGFISSLAEAQSTEQAKAAIEAAALPAGSYAIKRNALENISLNAYVGFSGGLEYTRGENGPILGLAAPVGLAYSWMKSKKVNNHILKPDKRSLTVFLQVIDVGALTSFRLTNDKDPLPQNIGFEHVFSPGAYLFINTKGPISIGFGGSYSPNLRDVKEDDIELDNLNAFRVNIQVGIDIPILNFRTRTEKLIKQN